MNSNVSHVVNIFEAFIKDTGRRAEKGQGYDLGKNSKMHYLFFFTSFDGV